VVPFVLAVRRDSNIESVTDLVKLAKEKPGEITQAHAGISSSNHLVSELFQLLTGTKFILVPYRGAGPAMNDVIAGQVQTFFDQATTTVPQVEGGLIRALAVTRSSMWQAWSDPLAWKHPWSRSCITRLLKH
jgi:tripartite-type tricarboxylate transporter receptor subunit TctC